MTETDIANRALSLLGQPPLVALDDGTSNARAIGIHFETVRDTLLRSHPWAFATARAELSELAEPPEFGWTKGSALSQLDLGEVIRIPREITSDERDSLEAYLLTKWGI